MDEKEQELTDKQFKQKIWIFFGIVCCVVAISFYVGATYGHNKGIETAKDYYIDYYIPKLCECREYEEVITYGKGWLNYSLLPDLIPSEQANQSN